MTEQKRLKRLVRDRMARTGESYTTARRHVLTAVAREHAGTAPPPGVVPGYDAFGGGQHRPSTLLAHLLRQGGHTAPHTGEAYTEAMLAGLAGGIGFMYAVFEYSGVPPLLTIVAQHHPDPWAESALGRLDIGYTEGHSSSTPAALTALNAALDDGRPVWCTLDRSALPWHARAHAVSADPYPVVVAGRHGDTLYLDDEAVTAQPVTEAEFARAWARHRKGRHHRLVVATAGPTGGPTSRAAGPGTTSRAAGTDLPAAIRGAVATTVRHLTGPVLGNSFDVNFGFSGMARLADQLRDGRTRNGWARRFGDPVPFFHGMSRLHECLEAEYTAPGATRPLYARFLDEAAGVTGDGRLAEAAELFRDSGALWSQVAARAAEAVAGLGGYTELCEERMLLIMTRGRSAAEEIQALGERAGAFAAAYADSDPLGDDGRRALFAELADLVDAARRVEERAVALMS